MWARVAKLLLGWALATAFTAIFSEDFSNAYLSYVVLVQLIFAFEGLKMGIAMFGLVALADMYHLFIHRGTNIQAHLFALSVQMLVGLLTWLFVSTIERTRQKTQQLGDEVAGLNRILLNAQDHERRRLARDIHDGPLQSLGVQLLTIERIRRYLEAGDRDKALASLQTLHDSVRGTIVELRGTVNTLRNNLLIEGIEPALHKLALKTEEATGLKVSVHIEVGQKLSEALQSCLYHLVVEALNNVRKHARASHATISLTSSPTSIHLSVRDDGVGFDYNTRFHTAISKGHIGLHSMRERAAEFGGVMEVTSAPGHGTVLAFRFPSSAIYHQPVAYAGANGNGIREQGAEPVSALS
jgi:signal transduction histidine kinase